MSLKEKLKTSYRGKDKIELCLKHLVWSLLPKHPFYHTKAQKDHELIEFLRQVTRLYCRTLSTVIIF